jgi:hypothetical protein
MRTICTIWNRAVFVWFALLASALALAGCEDGLLAGLFGNKGEAKQDGGGDVCSGNAGGC